MDQLKRLWQSFSTGQQISIGVSAVAAVFALVWLSSWRHEASFKPLYRGLDSEGAAAAVEKLRESGVEYRLEDDGATILVPTEALNETRLSMARDGVLRSGRMGFEMFDQNNFGTSDFAEQVNFRRALEGELERTIGTLSEVARSRVHLTFAKDSVYTEARQPAKASILLDLKRSGEISAGNIAAIANLVASAVEGLAPTQVTIVDSDGMLLNKPRQDAGAGLAPDGQIEYRAAFERELQNKLAQTLDPILGYGNYRAGVAVDLDFSRLEESEEVWDPDKSVMVSSQTTEESNTAGVLPSGVPGTQSSLPDGAKPQVGPGGIIRRTESNTYQTSKKVRHTARQQGDIKRITVAVLLDQESRWEGTGAQKNLVLTPPPPERVETIRNLITNVAGLNLERGDQLTVETLPFASTLNQEPPIADAAPAAPPFNLMDFLKDPRFLSASGGILAVLLGLVFWLVKRARRSRAKAVLAGASAVEASSSARARLNAPSTGVLSPQDVERLEHDLLESLQLQPRGVSKSDTLAKYLRLEVKKDPRAAADLLRHWLLEEGS